MQGVASHPVNRMEDPKRIIGKKWRAEEEEERHKGALAKKNSGHALRRDRKAMLLHSKDHFRSTGQTPEL
jgi:hypothetical protein